MRGSPANSQTGQRLESRSDFQAVLVEGHRVNHVLHLLLSLVTFGLWFIVWVSLAVVGGGEAGALPDGRLRRGNEAEGLRYRKGAPMPKKGRSHLMAGK